MTARNNRNSALANPLSIQELDGSVVTLSYDAADQLTTELRSDVSTPSNSYTMLYQWDPVGNPVQVTQDAYDTASVIYDSGNAYDTSLPYDPSPSPSPGRPAALWTPPAS